MIDINILPLLIERGRGNKQKRETLGHKKAGVDMGKGQRGGKGSRRGKKRGRRRVGESKVRGKERRRGERGGEEGKAERMERGRGGRD